MILMLGGLFDCPFLLAKGEKEKRFDEKCRM